MAQNRPYQATDNLFLNSDFEGTGGQWNNATFLKNAKVVSDSTAVSGNKSLYFDTSAQKDGAFYKFKVKVKPNTNYVLTYWYKHASDDTAKNTYCFVRGGNGTIDDAHISSAYMHTGSTTEWKKETLTFRTGDSDKLGIDFRVVKGTHVYIDDVELYEVQ